jgi:hypothetical protein
MTRLAVLLACGLGGALVARAGWTYRATDPLALLITGLIGAGLLLGAVEQWRRAGRVQRLLDAIGGLPRRPDQAALDAVPAILRPWIDAMRAGRPAPAAAVGFTPYLLGLLIMLGMLGTFIGLVDTMSGARELIASSADAERLRAGLGAPLSGLTRAFGTSIAGVSASATLGLAALFVRRAGHAVRRSLADYAVGPLQAFSPAGRQIAALESLAQIGQALPDAARALEHTVERIEALGHQLSEAQVQAGQASADAFRTAANEARVEVLRGLVSAAQATQDAVISVADQAAVQMSMAVDQRLGAWQARLDADLDARANREGDHLGAVRNQMAQTMDALADREAARSAAVRGAVQGLTTQVESLIETAALTDEVRADAEVARLGRLEAGFNAVVQAVAEHATDRTEVEAERLVHLDARFASLATQLEADATGRTAADAERIAQLDQSLAGLAKRLEVDAQLRANAAAARVAQLDQRFATLAERLETDADARTAADAERIAKLDHSFETIAGRAAIDAQLQADAEQRRLGQIDAGFEAVVDRLSADAQSRSQADIDRAEQLGTSLAETQVQLAELIQNHAQHEAGRLARLDTRFDAIGEKLMAQHTAQTQAEAARLGRLDARFDALGTRLQNQALNRAEADAAHLGRLDDGFATMANRLDGQIASRAATEASRLGALERGLEAVRVALLSGTERRAEADDQHLDGLRAGFAQLAERIEATVQHDARARTEALQTLQAGLADVRDGVDIGSQAHLVRLEAGFDSLRESLESGDAQRAQADAAHGTTQQSAVRETLAQIEALAHRQTEQHEAVLQATVQAAGSRDDAFSNRLATISNEVEGLIQGYGAAEQKRLEAFVAAVAQARTQLDAALLEAGSHTTEVVGLVRAWREDLDQLEARTTHRMRDTVVELSAALGAQADTFLASQAERVEAEAGHSTRLAAVVDRVETLIGHWHEGEVAARTRASELATALQATLSQQAAQLTEFEQNLDESRAQRDAAVTAALTTHAAGLGEGLAQTTAVVNQAAGLLQAGGAELESVAELFADAVHTYRASNERWLVMLAQLDDRREAEGDAAGRLVGEYLDQSREVFADAMRFQQELFNELRALREAST